MEQYVGLDVSQEQTSVCVIDGGGKVIWEGKCTSTPEAIAAILRTRAPEAVRIGLESDPLSAWHWHELRKLGLPVVCLDARHAKAALALQLNKSDRTACPGVGRGCPRPGADRTHRLVPRGGGQEHEQIGRAVAHVFAVIAFGPPRPVIVCRARRQRGAHLADQLLAALVQADHRALRVMRAVVDRQHVFHVEHERGRERPPAEIIGTDQVAAVAPQSAQGRRGDRISRG